MTIKKIVITCGQTGGHFYPGIALAQSLKEDAVTFIGSEHRIDSKIIPKYGFSFLSIPFSNRNPAIILKALFKAIGYLRRNRPHVVVSTGGGITVPVIIAAKLLRIPIVLLEQNTIPGRTNRLFACIADAVFVSFEQSLSYFNADKVILSGNPVRSSFLDDAHSAVFSALPIPELPIVLVFGGSQGADAINQVAYDSYSFFDQESYVLIHITGDAFFKKKFQGGSHYIQKNEQGQIKCVVFPYFERMDLLYQRASFVVSRAGATTIAELLYFQKQAMLIPYPFAKDNHQFFNAKAFQAQGRGVFVLQPQFDKLIFLAAIQKYCKTSIKVNQQAIDANEQIKGFLNHSYGFKM